MSQIIRLIPGSGPGSGTVTSITFNGGLTSTPDPVTTIGTATLDQTNLTVQDGTVYWDSGTQLLNTTATGTANQVLTSQGAGLPPIYADVSSTGSVTTLTGNNSGVHVPPNAGNINIVGSGAVTVTGNAGTNTLTISLSGGGFTWNLVSTATVMAAENGYVTNHPTVPVALTLPPVIPFGGEIEIAGYGAAGWIISQNAGQIIKYGNSSTTLSFGTLASTNQYDQVSLLCVVADSVFVVRSSIGNLVYT